MSPAPPLRRIDLRGDRSDPSDRLPRPPAGTMTDARDVVTDVLAAVQQRGDAAVAEYTRRFDGWDGSAWLVPPAELKLALEALDPELRQALETAAEQVEWFHRQSRPRDWDDVHDGATMGVRHAPVKRVGVYVPGGRAAYPSTVLMTVIPATVAGVDEIVLATPPGPSGMPNSTILAAAALLGVDSVVRVGGAQAVAALAFGTETIPKVDKIVGPGNAFVAEAKMQVAAQGVVGIDAMAGVTEVLLIADGTADPRLVATSLIAQAEHDPLVTSILVTPSERLADQVAPLVAEEVAALPTGERIGQALAGQGAVILVDDLAHAVEVSDAFAPEHLEIQTADARSVAEQIGVAGTIFVGVQTPTALGDYCAGPNHTLPTGGTARFTGGLRTDDFMVPINWVEFSTDSLDRMVPVVRALGQAEGLPAHVRSLEARLDARREGRL
ncbi:histidinol dehydrogenase [Euzebya tangerina]|uniref:histidinol dehydrogenase n=1 Tax=Euzebya tangerina TaxID=591198 RepID=UPI000E30F3F7|nr:histidinol dehydrogenase [Euzebya tangerina]